MGENLTDIIERRYSRRDVIKTISLAALSTSISGASLANEAALVKKTPPLNFKQINHSISEDIILPDGYEYRVLAKWDDIIGEGIRFGYNNDFIAYMPIKGSVQGLLCVNHEYTNTELMFPNVTLQNYNKTMAEFELKSIGHSVIEARKRRGKWKLIDKSQFNRRLNALDTEIEMSGPASGHDRLKTSYDTSGKISIGTLANCAGGKTPWGTVLIAEENFNSFFTGKHIGRELLNHKLYGVGKKPLYKFHQFFDRFDISKEPNEPNKFGWVVELNPYDPKSIPKKRTALGRFKHEGATFAPTRDLKTVIYMGDDEAFEHLYMFVSNNKFTLDAFDNNLLDDGTLYVAKFNDDGTLNWLPLKYGTSPLNEEFGFSSQADILIETRRAAKLLGATDLDRPEDVQTNPIDGKIYVVLTNNIKRLKPNKTNPRAFNKHGHILALTPPAAGHGSSTYNWDIFLLADGRKFANPDNIAFDNSGNMWIATDGMPKTMQVNDGVFACQVKGENKAKVKHFMSAPKGSEVCGPEFTPNGKTLFLAIQHPGSGSTYDIPSTRWPQFNDLEPPKPSIIAVTRKDGRSIGI